MIKFFDTYSAFSVDALLATETRWSISTSTMGWICRYVANICIIFSAMIINKTGAGWGTFFFNTNSVGVAWFRTVAFAMRWIETVVAFVGSVKTASSIYISSHGIHTSALRS